MVPTPGTNSGRKLVPTLGTREHLLPTPGSMSGRKLLPDAGSGPVGELFSDAENKSEQELLSDAENGSSSGQSTAIGVLLRMQLEATILRKFISIVHDPYVLFSRRIRHNPYAIWIPFVNHALLKLIKGLRRLSFEVADVLPLSHCVFFETLLRYNLGQLDTISEPAAQNLPTKCSHNDSTNLDARQRSPSNLVSLG